MTSSLTTRYSNTARAILNLPNFDSLRAESTVFTNTQPAGYHTVKIIPSLLTGKIVDGIRYNFHNRLWVHHEPNRAERPSRDRRRSLPTPNKPAGALRTSAGTTLIAPSIPTPSRTDSGPTTICSTASWLRSPHSGPTSTLHSSRWSANSNRPPAPTDISVHFDVRHRYVTQTDLQQHAFQVLHTDQADFVFLHFAIPHSPNIWSRINADYTQSCDSSYLDNLALTDRVLGQLVTTLKASPRWNNTTLIVQGDHG